MVLRAFILILVMMLSTFKLESIHEGSFTERAELIAVALKEVIITPSKQLSKDAKSITTSQHDHPGSSKIDSVLFSVKIVNRDLIFQHRQLLI